MRNLTKEDLDNFSGTLTPCIIAGPATLYRFAGNPKGIGEWWVEQSTFLTIYNEARDNCSQQGSNTTGTEFRRLYRKYISISLDWNDLLNFFKMDIPETSKVTGWTGKVKSQPFVSTRKQNEIGRTIPGMLSGGLEQLFIETYNPAWIRRVSL